MAGLFFIDIHFETNTIMNIDPIGQFRCAEEYPYDAARQATVSHDNTGTVTLYPGHNFEQALLELEGFSHIWLIFQFHKNDHWKPMVLPPRGDRKVGVFASRAPYRPNAIGISCVRLGEIRGREIDVFDHDLLDGTPILDIKPYLPYADSVPDATTGWVERSVGSDWSIDFAHTAKEQLAWLNEHHVDCIEAFLLQQLTHEPTNAAKKRVQHLQGDTWEIAYRTWRARFTLDEIGHCITIVTLYSGYTDSDLRDDADPYDDKSIHRAFISQFEISGK